MRHTLIPALLAAALAGPPAAGASGSLRCDGRVVGTEALAAEVLAACGEPAYRARWRAAPLYVADEEQWTYNFGARRLVHVLRFRQGRLVSIDTDGYGFDTPAATRCAPTDVVRGLGAFRLLHRCGPPATRESFDGVYPLHPSDPAFDQRASRPVHRERWVYDFGADTRMRIVTLHDGRVVDVELGDKGGSRSTQ